LREIQGFQSAAEALSRKQPTCSYPVSPALREGIKKVFGSELEPEEAVRQIINEVRLKGDAALIAYTLKIDGVKLSQLEVSKDEIKRAFKEISPELLSALKLAAEQISAFHAQQKQNIWHEIKKSGLGQLIRPLERVGIYVPGGTASYPSTVLMTAIPAKIAGVKEVILTTAESKWRGFSGNSSSFRYCRG